MEEEAREMLTFTNSKHEPLKSGPGDKENKRVCTLAACILELEQYRED